jgi:hypothetical protein
MPRSVYQELEREMLEAREERLALEHRQRELAELRRELVGFQLDLAIIKLKRALAQKYRPDQPRVPAGRPAAGQWTAGVGENGSPTHDRPGAPRARPRVAQYDIGALVAELPYRGGRNCVYKFSFGQVVIPGPTNLSCPEKLPSAAVTHGTLLNDN